MKINLQTWRSDISSGFVVFLVALPLCLGIALASGAPLFSGIVSGVIAGTIVALLSGSELSVSGPAAGLTVIVAAGITSQGSFEAFLAAVVMAGIFQIILGAIRAGEISGLFPTSVMEGMLAAIGLTIILKQIPNAIGGLPTFESDMSFWHLAGRKDTYHQLLANIQDMKITPFIIFAVSMAILFSWERLEKKRPEKLFKFIPGALIVVFMGAFLNSLLSLHLSDFALTAEDGHLVQLPKITTVQGLLAQLKFPAWSAFAHIKTYTLGLTIAIIASVETLLCLETTDKLDPQRRTSNSNRELFAQGVGNICSGLIGGIPMTSVIVRSSANIFAGAKSRLSCLVHGCLLFLSIIYFATILNLVPLAALAAILIRVGLKLSHPNLFKKMYHEGINQFLPFIVTLLAILFTDLLKGVGIGFACSAIFILWTNYYSAISVAVHENHFLVRFTKDVAFIHRTKLKRIFARIPNDAKVIVDGSRAAYIDHDIYQSLKDFAATSAERNIQIQFLNIENKEFPNAKEALPMEAARKLLLANILWAKENTRQDPKYFEKMALGQNPNFLWIGCSDSRVPAESITGSKPGELFVHRNIANQVAKDDPNFMSALNYAVDFLKVRDIVVCGHMGCGGVARAMEDHSEGYIDTWLDPLRDTFAETQQKTLESLVAKNVEKQIEVLKTLDIVRRAWDRGQDLVLHGWVYDISSGKLQDLVKIER